MYDGIQVRKGQHFRIWLCFVSVSFESDLCNSMQIAIMIRIGEKVSISLGLRTNDELVVVWH